MQTRGFLFLDFCGSVGFCEQYGAQTLAATLESAWALLEQQLAAQDVLQLYHYCGDAAVLLFDPERVVDAARGWIRFRDAWQQRGTGLFRAAMAAGEVAALNGRWYGQPLYIAARILASTEPGGCWVAADCWRESADFSTEIMGMQTLRGMRESVAVLALRAV